MAVFTKKEFKIMNVLWNSDTPLSVSEIYEKVETISERSLDSILKRLMDKGYIKNMGCVKSTLYAPAITVDEYAAMQIRNIYKTPKQSFNIFKLLSYFLISRKHKRDRNDIISNFEEFIDNYDQNNNKDSE